MAVRFTSNGSHTVGTVTVLSAAYPVAVSAGNLFVLVVGMKPAAANTGTVITPTGWSAGPATTFCGSYGATTGVDVGNSALWTFVKIADGTETASSGRLTVSLSGGGVNWCRMFSFESDSGYFNVGGDFWDKGTSGDIITTFNALPRTQGGDVFLCAVQFASDTPYTSASVAISQSGVVFSAPTAASIINGFGTTLGNDIGSDVWLFQTLSGSASPNTALNLTLWVWGTSTNARGPVQMIRISDKSSDYAVAGGPSLVYTLALTGAGM